MSIQVASGEADPDGMPLDQYRQHLTRRCLAASTIQRYLTDLRSFDRHTPILEATAEDVQTFLDCRNHQPRSRYRWISELHRFYQFAVAHGIAAADPTATIERPRLSRLLPRPIAERDLTRAIDAAGPTMRAWLTLTAYAGLRCAEIAHLDRSWIGPTDLRVVGKGGHERVVPMHPTVIEALRAAPLARVGPVFRNTHGQPHTPKEVSRKVAAYLDGLGIDDRAHAGRHRFATVAYGVSKDLRAVQELCGHAHAGTTAQYAAVNADDLAAVVAALPG